EHERLAARLEGLEQVERAFGRRYRWHSFYFSLLKKVSDKRPFYEMPPTLQVVPNAERDTRGVPLRAVATRHGGLALPVGRSTFARPTRGDVQSTPAARRTSVVPIDACRDGPREGALQATMSARLEDGLFVGNPGGLRAAAEQQVLRIPEK